MIFQKLNVIPSTIAIGLAVLIAGDIAWAQPNQPASRRSNASGTGVYLPRALDDPAGPGGDYFGPGFESELGEDFIYTGSLDLIEIRPGKFRFQNTGRGTDEEVFHEVMYVSDGSTVRSRFRGIVELDPVVDENGDPTGQFTADWNGTWVNVGGTGRFRNAKGSVRVNAVNEPFTLEDFAWNFSFTWTGNLTVPNRPVTANVVELSTLGQGVFDPANLGINPPGVMLPPPFVIGDGSGAGVYDGTPTGTATIGGMDSPDQHWGVAQSTRPGVLTDLTPQSINVWYPIVVGANPRPDAGGAAIHIMHTDFGEIYFSYKGYFELDGDLDGMDLAGGVIIGRASFQVVGGTGMFDGATGAVYVRVDSNLDDVTGFPNMPAAPFVYDFRGYVELADGN